MLFFLLSWLSNARQSEIGFTLERLGLLWNPKERNLSWGLKEAAPEFDFER